MWRNAASTCMFFKNITLSVVWEGGSYLKLKAKPFSAAKGSIKWFCSSLQNLNIQQLASDARRIRVRSSCFYTTWNKTEEFKHLRLSENVDPSGSLVIACMVTWLPRLRWGSHLFRRARGSNVALPPCGVLVTWWMNTRLLSPETAPQHNIWGLNLFQDYANRSKMSAACT